jgi:hypothetical protein
VLRLTSPKRERPRTSATAAAKARRVPVPTDVATLELLDRVDYADALEIQAPDTRSPGEWTRFLLDTAPPTLLTLARAVQRMLGSGSPESTASTRWGGRSSARTGRPSSSPRRVPPGPRGWLGRRPTTSSA